MQIPLVSDLRNDNSLRKNTLRIFLFLFLVIILDYIISLLLLRGVEKNYGLKSDADILLVGHSHLMLAIDKVELEKLTGLKVSKYTREGVNIMDRDVMLKQYFATCKKKPEFVVLSVDPWLFTGEGLSKNSYMLFYPFMDTPDVDQYIRSSAPNNFEYIKHKYFRSTRFDVSLINASLRGYLGNWTNFKFGTIDTLKLQKEINSGIYRRIKFEKDNISSLANILNFLEKQNVKVILLNTPIYKTLVEVQSADNQKSIDIIIKLATKHKNATFIDISPEYSNKAAFFFDPIHMNPEGQKAVTVAFYMYFNNI